LQDEFRRGLNLVNFDFYLLEFIRFIIARMRAVLKLRVSL